MIQSVLQLLALVLYNRQRRWQQHRVAAVLLAHGTTQFGNYRLSNPHISIGLGLPSLVLLAQSHCFSVLNVILR